MRYSRVLALLFALNSSFSSEGFRLRQTGGYDVVGYARPDIEEPSEDALEQDKQEYNEEHDGQNDEELSFVQEEDSEDGGENLEDPEESSFEEEGDEDGKEQGDDEEHDKQEVVDDDADPDDISNMTTVMLQTQTDTRRRRRRRSKGIPLTLKDCGDSSTLGKMTAMQPTSVKLGVTQMLTLSGIAKRTVPGGTLDLRVKLKSFPYTTLGSLKKADVCKDHKLDLYVGPIHGGSLTLKGMTCPIRKGKIQSIVYLTLKKSNSAEVSIKAKHGRTELLCTEIDSGR